MLSFYCHAVVKLKQAIIISLNHAELLRNAENDLYYVMFALQMDWIFIIFSLYHVIYSLKMTYLVLFS